MPDDEVWIKIDGYHGGGSFKLSVQVCNLDSPNAKEITIVFACCEAKDPYENLKEMVSNFKGDVTKLSQASWRNRHVRLFLYGDYAFLSSLYGLSGAKGTHFCL